MNKILIVEDDNTIHDMVKEYLNKRGFQCEHAYSGTEALLVQKQENCDLILMDLMLPGLDGKQALTKIKKEYDVPVIIVSAKNTIEDKVSLLAIGADDYMTKPFSVDELEARLRAISRRRGQAVADNNIKVGNVTLNIKEFTLSAGGRSIALSGKEYELAFCFFSNPSAVFTKDELINKVWGFDCDFESNNLEVYISFLRKKLNYLDPEVTISSVRGVGYKLVTKGING